MITEIRNKTGLSQSQLALYLGVSRGMINLVERKQRQLMGEASKKLTLLYLQLLENEQAGKKVAKNNEALPSKAWRKKQETYHHTLMLDYEYKAGLLKQKLEKMKDDHVKTTAQLTLVNNAGAKAGKVTKSNRDGLWFDSLSGMAILKIEKTGPDTQQTLQLEMKVLLGYAKVHRKIVEELGEKR